MQNGDRIFYLKSATRHKTPPATTNPVLAYLKWLLLTLKSIGLIPFYTTLNHNEIATPNLRGLRINRAILCLKIILNLIHICALLSPAMIQILFSRSKTDGFSNVLDVFFCLLSDVTISWSCACGTNKFIEIINRILKIDQQLKSFPESPGQVQLLYKNPYNLYMSLILGYISFIMVPFIKRTMNVLSLYYCIYLMIYQLENTVSCIFVIFVAALLRLLTQRFQFINQLLMQYNNNNKDLQQSNRLCSYVNIRPPYRVDERSGGTLGHSELNLRQFVFNSKLIYGLHNDLLELYKMINSYASLGLLVFLLYAFYGLLSCIYTSLLFDGESGENIFYFIWTLSWIPLYAVILILLTTHCDAVTKEANETSKILSRIYGSASENQSVIDKFLVKCVKQDVQFTAYGFFVIDNTTLFKVFTAVTTYLVILIQFKQLEGTKEQNSTKIN